jgi:hypothetical protein
VFGTSSEVCLHLRNHGNEQWRSKQRTRPIDLDSARGRHAARILPFHQISVTASSGKPYTHPCSPAVVLDKRPERSAD